VTHYLAFEPKQETINALRGFMEQTEGSRYVEFKAGLTEDFVNVFLNDLLKIVDFGKTGNKTVSFCASCANKVSETFNGMLFKNADVETLSKIRQSWESYTAPIPSRLSIKIESRLGEDFEQFCDPNHPRHPVDEMDYCVDQLSKVMNGALEEFFWKPAFSVPMNGLTRKTVQGARSTVSGAVNAVLNKAIKNLDRDGMDRLVQHYGGLIVRSEI